MRDAATSKSARCGPTTRTTCSPRSAVQQGVVATTFLYVQARLSRRRRIAYFWNVDFANHVALIALAEEDGRKFIIGGGRYVVVEPVRPRSPCRDRRLSGQGVGTLLMRHLAIIARKAG